MKGYEEMIVFKPPCLEDHAWADSYLSGVRENGCEFNFATLYIWSEALGIRIARIDDFVLAHTTASGGGYMFPAGCGKAEIALKEIVQYCDISGEQLRFVWLDEEHKSQLETIFPGRFNFLDDRNSWDYLYDINKLSDLTGKKMHAKRNHINRFENDFPGWTYEQIGPENIDDCIEMDDMWRIHHRESDDDGERRAIEKALRNMNALGLDGGLIRLEGKVVAYTVGDHINDNVFNVHFEKAVGEIPGAYAIINREFARRIREKYPEVIYINREDDMGLEGLRKAKESYYPDRMVKKYIAVPAEP